MTNRWTNALPLILVLFVSTIHSNTAHAGERGAIGATVVSMTRDPKIDSPLVAQLRIGDIVEVLERQNNFVKIQYKIEDEFPVTGWIPSAALVPATKTNDPANQNVPVNLNVQSQAYHPAAKEKTITEVEKFPEMSSSAALTSAPAQPFSSTTEATERTENESINAAFVPRSWHPKLMLEFSSISFEEAFKTKNPTSASSGYYAGDFLSYELNGAAVTLSGSFAFDLDWAKVGGILRYSFAYFSDGISGNPFINTSNLQAQLHQIHLGPIVQREFTFAERWHLIPELRALIGYQSFASNQLSDSRQYQPVVMNDITFEGRLELSARLETPYDHLFFEPIVGVTLYQSFTETPSIETDSSGAALADGSKIKTGNPKSKIMQIHYGGTLGIQLHDWNMPHTEIYFRGEVQDFSREYSGIGNRAGFKVSDAKSNSILTTLGLGIRRSF